MTWWGAASLKLRGGLPTNSVPKKEGGRGNVWKKKIVLLTCGGKTTKWKKLGRVGEEDRTSSPEKGTQKEPF